MSIEFIIKHENIYLIPIIHGSLECAGHVRNAILSIEPDCVAVELPECFENNFLKAAQILPSPSVITHEDYVFLAENTDPLFEALRTSLDIQAKSYCIDIFTKNYQNKYDKIPDTYAINKIGSRRYWELVLKNETFKEACEFDLKRESFISNKLKKFSKFFNKIVFVGGAAHISRIQQQLKIQESQTEKSELLPSSLYSPTEESLQSISIHGGFVVNEYEKRRISAVSSKSIPDRYELMIKLLKQAIEPYETNCYSPFPKAHLKIALRFAYRYARIKNNLCPNLHQIIISAKACVNENYGFEVWKIATEYPNFNNILNLPKRTFSPEDFGLSSKFLTFHLKQKKLKRQQAFSSFQKNLSKFQIKPSSLFSLCSYQPEDLVIESLGSFLKKKTSSLIKDNDGHSKPFICDFSDGIDVKETIRNKHTNKIFIKQKGKPSGEADTIVLIFEEESISDTQNHPWKMSWLGENTQESDMAFYATNAIKDIVGPGIFRCKYGGLMMTSPPQRLLDIWVDNEYKKFSNKQDVLLAAAIDYSIKPVIAYIAKHPPCKKLQNLALNSNKQVVFIPIGSLSPITINKIRTFHVLDGQDKREIAGNYII